MEDLTETVLEGVAVKPASGAEIAFGLRDDELDQFEATFDESEDILLQLG